MPRGYPVHSELKRGRGGSSKKKRSPSCQMCGSALFRGVTCPICDDDLIDLFVLCVFDGTARVNAAEAFFLGLDARFARSSGRMAG